jgi:hypothetical protein
MAKKMIITPAIPQGEALLKFVELLNKGLKAYYDEEVKAIFCDWFQSIYIDRMSNEELAALDYQCAAMHSFVVHFGQQHIQDIMQDRDIDIRSVKVQNTMRGLN